MKDLLIRIPQNLDLEAQETSRFLAAKLFDSGKVTLGQAAEIAGLSKTTFAEILKDYSVSLINYSSEEAIADAEKI